MATVQDPLSDFDVAAALRKLLEDLRREDPTIGLGEDPLHAATGHLRRCKPRPAIGTKSQMFVIPEEPRPPATPAQPAPLASPEKPMRCCAKALVIRFLAAESGVNPTVQPLLTALAEARPHFDKLEASLAPSLAALLKALEAQHQRLGPTDPKTEARVAFTFERPAFNPAASWIGDALAAFYRSPAWSSASKSMLHEQLLLLLNGLLLVGSVRDQLAHDLRRHFVFPELHTPRRPGRPELSLLNELSLFLAETGHTTAEITRFLPDQSGSSGAAARTRERIRPARKSPKKPKKAK